MITCPRVCSMVASGPGKRRARGFSATHTCVLSPARRICNSRRPKSAWHVRDRRTLRPFASPKPPLRSDEIERRRLCLPEAFGCIPPRKVWAWSLSVESVTVVRLGCELCASWGDYRNIDDRCFLKAWRRHCNKDTHFRCFAQHQYRRRCAGTKDSLARAEQNNRRGDRGCDSGRAGPTHQVHRHAREHA